MSGDLIVPGVGDPWPADPEAARAVQERLAGRVRPEALEADAVSVVAGLDVTYAVDEERLVAAAVVMTADTLEVVETSVVTARPRFPYVPGLFAFRELPPLLEAVDRLRVRPDVYVCDGYGLAHPRRFGLACHLGVLLDRPALGVAKSAFVGRTEAPAAQRGAWSELREGEEVLGRALRTREGVKPVYVSVGHRVDLEGATRLVLRLTPRYRLPEPIRRADQLSRGVLAGRTASSG
ncbi:Endonuclease V [Marinactinospora thermotolerans DSM 45154]|uniref:Endonuclease V n=1 Tax=Marinactinospora thermotolerans DSM 45154 TaxID=1122192 RepID=A0A1T4KAK5_9ACTN|nr:endonuclease V [Marinactinospora thermotolerans]SJZ39441.1 Endonuclease V [Marinactinospora thermotolerans DSM 45154]